MSCCASCDQGHGCESSRGLGLLAAVGQDDTIPPDVENTADGSLDFLGLPGLTHILAPTFAGDWSGVDISALPPEAFGIPSSTLQGLGQIEEAIAAGLQYAPSVAQWIEHAFKLGAGRKEADIIVPNQNELYAYMVQQEQASRSGDPIGLRQIVLNLQELRYNWIRFLSDPRFVDGRASRQAAETIMPLLDGTCGYQIHTLEPTSGLDIPVGSDTPCLSVTGNYNAWPHNFGYGPGLLGAVRSRTVAAGGALPSSGAVTQGVGMPSFQFPQTAGATNLPPQPGQYPGQSYNVPSPGYYSGSASVDWTSDPMTLALIGLAAFFVLR